MSSGLIGGCIASTGLNLRYIYLSIGIKVPFQLNLKKLKKNKKRNFNSKIAVGYLLGWPVKVKIAILIMSMTD